MFQSFFLFADIHLGNFSYNDFSIFTDVLELSKCRWSVAVFLLWYGVTVYNTVWGQHGSVWMR